ncbi:class B sortase [Ruminococcaceae bacterium OttesenSCG-928-D13]|nr:class B sortase [Ruminococcaceae bacterium OttesenSCG-928-D13]
MKKRFLVMLASMLVVLMGFSGFQLWRYFTAERETQQQYDGLVEQIKSPPPSASGQGAPGEEPKPEWTVNDQYGPLFEENPDMLGWISIEGTALNYPVMHTPGSPDFYLRRNFEKQYSEAGVPYAAEGCSVSPQSDNITIYGHHMKSGKLFGALDGYKNEAFWREHPIIRFDTRAGFGEYEVFAMFKVIPADFLYHSFINAAEQAEFDEYVRRCKSLSFYDTGITAAYGDELITLSTCEYSQEDGRLVVVARKIREGGA